MLVVLIWIAWIRSASTSWALIRWIRLSRSVCFACSVSGSAGEVFGSCAVLRHAWSLHSRRCHEELFFVPAVPDSPCRGHHRGHGCAFCARCLARLRASWFVFEGCHCGSTRSLLNEVVSLCHVFFRLGSRFDMFDIVRSFRCDL